MVNETETENLCLVCRRDLTNLMDKRRKYCSPECAKIYNRKLALDAYNKIKDNPEYKEYRKQYFRDWVKKNNNKFKAYMRKYYQDRKQDGKNI